MPRYVMLMRDHSSGLKALRDNPQSALDIRHAIERWEAKIIASYRLLGEWDQCYIFDAPDNFKAYRSTLAQEFSTTSDTEILPAVDLDLFERLISQSAKTGGPHPWQIKWWAQIVRLLFYYRTYTKWSRRTFTRHDVFGTEKLRHFRGPCIVVANHTSHYDQMCLIKALPWRIKLNLFIGAAADRWFLEGRKEISLRPWYQSLVAGLYPIHRGGGSRALDYPRWLLDNGANILLFPEGTRARGRTLSPFKHGVSILALEKGVPIVPIYLEGLRHIRPPGRKEAVPGPVAAHVLDPIHFPPGTKVPEATEMVYRAMRKAHEAALAREDATRGGSSTS
ncbi:MAG: 1-acyl-sn-glycerol-3-phosphate acyltransferase [Pseudomonadales bacterium]|nr:1-acyl-sn-glycerol-3-phosphate acyltransferase [Pseudomonadales bacterium]MCP5185652.1 1-acyl-sn-glycerol-3-phosphate acyltransferase [Pseudomonadales bacterium]